MKYYIGLDISMEETHACVMGEDRSVLTERALITEPEDIAEFIKGCGVTVELVGLESGALSHWLTEELLKLEIPVKCIDARHCAAVLSMKVNKTDRNDARGLAEIMRCGLYKEVALKTEVSRAESSIISSRKLLVQQRVQTFGAIRGLLKQKGVRLGTLPKSEKAIERIEAELANLHPLVEVAITPLLDSLRTILKGVKKLDKEIQQLVKGKDEAKLLQTIPGVGPITALSFLLELGNKERFEKSKSVGAFIGLTPRQYSSGETQKQGRISKCGPAGLRSLLVEAAVVLITRIKSRSLLKAWGEKLKKRNGLKKAATAVARKLAVIMHRMLVTGEVFRFSNKSLDGKAV